MKATRRRCSADSITNQEEERVRGLHRQRRGRIQRIHHADLGAVQLNARRAKEKFLSDLQMRHFNAKRNLPLELQACDERYEEFSAKVKEQRKAYLQLEHRTREEFSGYSAFKRMLRREPQPELGTLGKPEALLQKLRTTEHTASAGAFLLLLPRSPRHSLAGWIVVILAT